MNQKGYSLLECVIAMALIGIIAAIAIPDYAGWGAQNRFKSAHGELMSNINLTKWIAVNKNKPITLTIRTNPFSGKAEYVTTDNLIPAVTFPSDVQLIGALPISVTFNSRGQRISSTNWIDLGNRAGHIFRIAISANGKVSQAKMA